MIEIGCFDDMLDYLDRVGRQYGFITGPGAPGWIPQAQGELCDLANMIENAVGYPCMIHYNREHGTLTAVGSRSYHWTYYNGQDNYTHDFDYIVVNPRVPATIRCDTLTNLLPHGSGIDCDWHFTLQANGSIRAYNSYHAMTEYGMYWGYLDFSATLAIDPQFGTLSLQGLRFHTDYVPEWLGGRSSMIDYLWETIDYL